MAVDGRLAAAVIRLRLGDDLRTVTVGASGAGLEVVIDGRKVTVDVREVGPHAFVLQQGRGRETFHCLRDGDDVHLHWRGEVYRLRRVREGQGIQQRARGGGLEAPMPGKVIVVHAKAGQTVVKGQELAVVESMKMENAVRAPHDGIVRLVLVKVGDLVGPGSILVEME